MGEGLFDSVKVLRGVGPARQKALEKLGILTLHDLLYHFPRAYEHRGSIKLLKDGTDGICSAFMLRVETVPRYVKVKGQMQICSFRAADSSGSIEVVFFNQPYIAKQVKLGETYRFWGRLYYKNGRWQMSSPQMENANTTQELPDFLSRYALCEGLSQKVMVALVKEALERVLPTLSDFLPEDIRLKYQLPTLSRALYSVHFPDTEERLSGALRRLMFDELFCLGMAVSLSKSQHAELRMPAFKKQDLTPFLNALPFPLTGAQKRSITEMVQDMCQGDHKGETSPMRRILIGDVGSGKTVCAAAAAFIAVENGMQVAVMVPTGILAHQHYEELCPMFQAFGYHVALLTGSTTAAQKRAIEEGLSGVGERIDIVIGTHALLQNYVHFENLGLVITDEQHRFGVAQRANLKEKSGMAHLLVMSATPIPRTLALAMYGDLAVSKLDELPPGRQRVDTFVVDESYRQRLHGFIEKQVSEGGQVYIVCPSIEGSAPDESPEEEVSWETLLRATRPSTLLPLKDAVGYAERLSKEVFPHLRVALLHGQMKNAEKDRVMQSFSQGEVDILVSTTVIEVGVNVPNANLMIVENAERFGLSQLHQLRGRVGRGKRKSYCILVSDSKGENAEARLLTMKNCYDGYQIAEKDLMLRGPGDFFGAISQGSIRQSGGISLRLASAASDTVLMQNAFSASRSILEKDPSLSLSCHQSLKEKIDRVFTLSEATIS